MLKYYHILKRFCFLLISIFLYNNSYAQENYTIEFLKLFNKQSLAGKVHMFDTLNVKFKPECYRLIKNQLESIKEQAVIDNQTEILTKFAKIEGELYFQNRNYSKAIPVFTDLLVKNKIKSAIDSARVLYFLKISYFNIHSLSKTINIHRVIVGIKKKHPEINGWILYPKLSNIYYEMKLYKECLNQQLLEFEDIKNNKDMLLNYYNDRGLFWAHYGMQDSAIICYNKARAIFSNAHLDNKLSLSDEFTISLIEGNIGQSYIALKEYYKAIPLLKKDVLFSIKSQNYLNAAISEIELSKCYLLLQQYPLSKSYLDSANTRLKNIDDYRTKLNILKQYAVYYEKMGLQRLCLDYYKRYTAFKDSTDAQENLRELISAQVSNQMVEKETLIRENQQKIKERTDEVDKQRTIKNILFLGGGILVFIIIIVSSQLRKTKAQKQLLELKNRQIETRNVIINKALVEKDLLIKEVHHRVKNNLQIISSLLKLQSGKTQNQEILNSLKEAQDRINSMALLHQLLYRNNQMTTLLFNEYLSNLVSQLSDSFSLTANHIIIKQKLVELELDLDTAIPLGLITNELISNAYKHAFKNNKGLVTIELAKLYKNTYMLKVSDDGVGMPADFDITRLHSLGLDIVSILSDQISAELKIYNDPGANFEIHFTKK